MMTECTEMMWQRCVAVTWANQLLTRGIHRVDVKVPRGPITGCHVAPRVLPILPMSKIIVVGGIRTRTFAMLHLRNKPRPLDHRMFHVNMVAGFIFKLGYVLFRGGSRAGA
jgi:hypothetical protein